MVTVHIDDSEGNSWELKGVDQTELMNALAQLGGGKGFEPLDKDVVMVEVFLNFEE